MPSLDAYTLAVTSALAALFMAITMGGIFLAGNREHAIADWALAGVLFCLGHMLGNLAMAGTVVIDLRTTIALGNTSIFLAYGLILVGIQEHLGHRRSGAMILAMALAILAAGLFWPGMYANTSSRVGLLATVYMGLAIACTFMLWRAEDRMLAGYRKAVALVILGNAVLLSLRAVYIALGRGESAEPGGVNVMVPAFLSSMVFYMALNVALALLLFRRKEAHLRHMARHDALTGLLNRYSLEEYAAREMARVDRSDHQLSVVLLDLDNFKRINDEHGHAAGDRVLVEAADRVREMIREGDIAFRVGGEEFLVLLPGADGREAARIADRLRRSLADGPFRYRSTEIRVSTSVGVVAYDPVHDNWESLQRRADQALYRAKDGGRNRVELAPDRASSPGAA
ncbi:GGDEF domain-containing protein [Wenzhouxiangella sediminis]|uniref:diguanylate cyclase n=1 Tax=Wenzhouxiangella sediminis TaxID=1792836 RepID=A0A3E1K8P7_9GAMM|nr:GGDEF domain-containing protein [Wenzhouxiangella sediminis]RFF30461.1 GGDEF domain-containing protein [Wenzhouxiangella sediminis]